MLVVCHIAAVIPWLLNDISTGCHAEKGMQGRRHEVAGHALISTQEQEASLWGRPR